MGQSLPIVLHIAGEWWFVSDTLSHKQFVLYKFRCLRVRYLTLKVVFITLIAVTRFEREFLMEKLDFLYPQCDLWPFHYLPSDSFIMSQSFVGLSKHNYQICTLPIAVIYFFGGGKWRSPFSQRTMHCIFWIIMSTGIASSRSSVWNWQQQKIFV